jgi:hypothetical protein
MKVDKNVVSRIRKKAESTGAAAPVKKRIGKDGKARKQPPKRSSIEKPPIEKPPIETPIKETEQSVARWAGYCMGSCHGDWASETVEMHDKVLRGDPEEFAFYQNTWREREEHQAKYHPPRREAPADEKPLT